MPWTWQRCLLFPVIPYLFLLFDSFWRNSYESAIVCWQSPARALTGRWPPSRTVNECLIIAFSHDCVELWLYFDCLLGLLSPPSCLKITINSLKFPESHEIPPSNSEVTAAVSFDQDTFMVTPTISQCWKLEASNAVKFLLKFPLAKRQQQFLHCSVLFPSLQVRALDRKEKERGREQRPQAILFLNDPGWFKNTLDTSHPLKT